MHHLSLKSLSPSLVSEQHFNWWQICVPGDTEEILGPYCGSARSEVRPFRFTSSIVSLVFVTDESLTFRGFLASYQLGERDPQLHRIEREPSTPPVASEFLSSPPASLNSSDWFADNVTTPCGASACRNGGTCVPAGSSFTCLCPPSFTGARCEGQYTETFERQITSSVRRGNFCLIFVVDKDQESRTLKVFRPCGSARAGVPPARM